jgi:hypothetical protein
MGGDTFLGDLLNIIYLMSLTIASPVSENRDYQKGSVAGKLQSLRVSIIENGPK